MLPSEMWRTARSFGFADDEHARAALQELADAINEKLVVRTNHENSGTHVELQFSKWRADDVLLAVYTYGNYYGQMAEVSEIVAELDKEVQLQSQS